MQGPEEDAGLSGKVALISGGGAVDDGIGNGRAAAVLLARAGVKVLVADRDLALAERTAEMITAEGGTAAALGGDVTNETDCRQLVEAAVDRFGRAADGHGLIGVAGRAATLTARWQCSNDLPRPNTGTNNAPLARAIGVNRVRRCGAAQIARARC